MPFDVSRGISSTASDTRRGPGSDASARRRGLSLYLGASPIQLLVNQQEPVGPVMRIRLSAERKSQEREVVG